MRILALDPSKRATGWACYEPGWETARFGTWDRLGSEFTSRGDLFYALYKALYDHRLIVGIDKIFAEEPVNLIPGGVATTAENVWIAVGMAATIELFAASFGVRLQWVHQAKWRRHFLGRMGRQKSKDLKDYALERARQLGFRPRRHDEADALGVLDYAMDFERLDAPWRTDEVLRQPLGKVA